MSGLRPDTVGLFAPMGDALVELLGGLTPEQWTRPTVCGDWDMHDVTTHLLGVDTANVFGRGDRWDLHEGSRPAADARLETDAANAWRLFTRHPRAIAIII